MRDLLRVVRRALRFRFALLTAMICSLLVGVLWGANIGIMYPFVEIVFRGESMQDSLSAKLDEAQRQSDGLEKQIAELRQELGAAVGADALQLQQQIDALELQLTGEQNVIAKARRYLPLLEEYFPHDPFQSLLVVVAGIIVATLLKSLFLVASEVLVARVTQNTMLDLQNDFYARVLNQDLSMFGEDRASKLMSCFTHRIQALSAAVRTIFGQAVREPLKMAACFVGAAFISWQLLVLSLIMAPLGLILLRLLTKSIRRGSRHDLNLMSDLYKRLSESFFGILTVKSFNAEPFERERFRDVTQQLAHRRKRNALYLALIKPVSEVMGIAIIAVAILVSSYLVLNRETHLFGIRISDQPLSPAALMVFYGLLAGVADPARKLTSIYGQLMMGAMAAGQVFRLMQRESRITDPAEPRPVPRPHRELAFDGVSFAYQEDVNVLDNVHLRIRFGERIAIVGSNGCGKSTMAKLIQRFYDTSAGSIRLDGIDIREFRVQDLRQMIGMVSQQTWLFDDTIMNNIRYGNLEATDQQVIEAAKHAQAHQFIETQLSESYQTVVGERGEALSGGQRQRIALARILLRDPQILILDEATSEIDPESEALVHRVLDQFLRNRTTIMITHRLSSLSLADRIVVMDRGHVLDSGTHDQLLARCDAYQRLWKSQTHAA